MVFKFISPLLIISKLLLLNLIFNPIEINISIILFTSLIKGTLDNVVFPLIINKEQSMAIAEFLAELVLIDPVNLLPPLIIKLDIKLS